MGDKNSQWPLPRESRYSYTPFPQSPNPPIAQSPISPTPLFFQALPRAPGPVHFLRLGVSALKNFPFKQPESYGIDACEVLGNFSAAKQPFREDVDVIQEEKF